METSTRKIRDFEAFYDSNKESLLCDTNDVMKIVSEYDSIYHDVLIDFSDEAKPLLLQLMFRHYPDFRSINHIACIEYIDRVINNHIYTQIIHMCNLCRL